MLIFVQRCVTANVFLETDLFISDTKDYYAHHKALIEMEAKYKNNTAILNGVVTSWIRPFKLYLQFVKQFNGDPIVLDEGM